MKKSIKLFDKKISQFPDIISWAKNLEAVSKTKNTFTFSRSSFYLKM